MPSNTRFLLNLPAFQLLRIRRQLTLPLSISRWNRLFPRPQATLLLLRQVLLLRITPLLQLINNTLIGPYPCCLNKAAAPGCPK